MSGKVFSPSMIRLGQEETRASKLLSRIRDTAKSVQVPDESWESIGSIMYDTPMGASYRELRDVVLNNSVLMMGVMVRSQLATDSGFYIEGSGGKRVDRGSKKQSLEDWAKDHTMWRCGGGIGGICQVVQQVLVDRHMFGSGMLELLPPQVRGAGRARIAGVAHLPRMNVRMLRPRKYSRKTGGQVIEYYEPQDIVFPRMAYSSGLINPYGQTFGTIRYIKAFGDDRRINSFTGEPDQSCAYEDEATEYVRLRNYVPGYEEGYPEWLSALQCLDITDALKSYFSHVMRNNAIPDLMVVLKGVGIDQEYVRKMENKFRSVRQRRERLENHVNVIVWSIEDDVIGDDEDDGGPGPEKGIEFKELNPIDGNTIRALLEVEKRNELGIAMTMRIPSQLLNYEKNTGLGSGAEIVAAINLMKSLVIGPDQGKVHELLDRIVRDGRGIRDYRLRLESPSYNDPKAEAEIAALWSAVRGMFIDEIRDKIGLADLASASKPAPGEKGLDIGKVMMMPAKDRAMTVETLENMFKNAGELPPGDEKDEAQKELDAAFTSDEQAVLANMVGRIREIVGEELAGMGIKVAKEGE